MIITRGGVPGVEQVHGLVDRDVSVVVRVVDQKLCKIILHKMGITIKIEIETLQRFLPFVMAPDLCGR